LREHDAGDTAVVYDCDLFGVLTDRGVRLGFRHAPDSSVR
jgi:hypothetical protein